MQAGKTGPKVETPGSERSFWVPKERLGLISVQMDLALTETRKAKRCIYFRRIVKILKELSVIPHECRVNNLCYGLNYLGEEGLFISTWVPTRLIPSGELA